MPRRRRVSAVVFVGAIAVAGCSDSTSGDDDVAPTSPALTTDSSAADFEQASDVTPGDVTSETPPDAPTEPPPPIPDDADVMTLSDAFDGDSESWPEEGSWQVDEPGEASATVVDGVGIMETDLRGTHEWVRATTENSRHENATLFARITPRQSNEGTVFVGLRGNGEWRDNFRYIAQTGVVLEYGYSPVFEGEVTIIAADGDDQRRVGPVPGPVLNNGETAEIRFEVEGDWARAKVWRTGDDEPSDWLIHARVTSPAPGVVQISYRDGVGQSVAWDELRLLVWPTEEGG